MTVILMDLLTGMEFDLFVPSFPELQHQFHLSPFLVEGLLSANFIGYCLSLFFVGSLADYYGRKPIILSGLIIFIFGSMFCLLGISYPLLLAGRFLQGIGIAAPAILSFLIIADAYPLKKQQYFMAMLNGAMNTAVAIAPVIGSYLTLYFHWRGNFSVLLFLGIFVFVMAICFIPVYKLPQHKEALSFRGYVPLFQSKSLVLLMMNIIFMFMPYWVFVGMSPLLYIKSLKVGLAHFGYYQGVLALVFAIGSIVFGLIIHRFEQIKLLRLLNPFYAASLVSIALVTIANSSSPLLITLAFLIFIISQIIPSNLLGPVCLNFIPQAKGKISAVLQGSRLIFSALSLQIAGYFYHGSFREIGIIIAFFIIMGMVTQFFITRNQDIISKLSQVEPT